MRKHLVFVYGTLRKGESNHSLLSDADLVLSDCWTYGRLFDTGHGYPCMIPHTQERVIGELYAVKDEELKRLDVLEEYDEQGKNNLYDRIIQPIYAEDSVFLAYLYVFSKDQVLDLAVIESGDWKK